MSKTGQQIRYLGCRSRTCVDHRSLEPRRRLMGRYGGCWKVRSMRQPRTTSQVSGFSGSEDSCVSNSALATFHVKHTTALTRKVLTLSSGRQPIDDYVGGEQRLPRQVRSGISVFSFPALMPNPSPGRIPEPGRSSLAQWLRRSPDDVEQLTAPAPIQYGLSTRRACIDSVLDPAEPHRAAFAPDPASARSNHGVTHPAPASHLAQARAAPASHFVLSAGVPPRFGLSRAHSPPSAHTPVARPLAPPSPPRRTSHEA